MFIVISAFSVSLLLYAKNKNQPAPNPSSQIVLFYGEGCLHCKIVEEYIKENNIKDKVSFVEKEVYYNQENQKELIEKAKICGFPKNNIGVPFLWDGKTCIIGDQDIINFFKTKTGQ